MTILNFRGYGESLIFFFIRVPLDYRGYLENCLEAGFGGRNIDEEKIREILFRNEKKRHDDDRAL
jgi:hypothetical protein